LASTGRIRHIIGFTLPRPPYFANDFSAIRNHQTYWGNSGLTLAGDTPIDPFRGGQIYLSSSFRTGNPNKGEFSPLWGLNLPRIGPILRGYYWVHPSFTLTLGQIGHHLPSFSPRLGPFSRLLAPRLSRTVGSYLVLAPLSLFPGRPVFTGLWPPFLSPGGPRVASFFWGALLWGFFAPHARARSVPLVFGRQCALLRGLLRGISPPFSWAPPSGT